MENISSALAFLHASCIIHRDLKPENLFFKNETGMRQILVILTGYRQFFENSMEFGQNN
jgi:serine/threonine protein kinase